MGEKNEHEMAHWCEVAKRQTYIQNTSMWLECGCVDLFGEKENWFQTDV